MPLVEGGKLRFTAQVLGVLCVQARPPPITRAMPLAFPPSQTHSSLRMALLTYEGLSRYESGLLLDTLCLRLFAKVSALWLRHSSPLRTARNG